MDEAAQQSSGKDPSPEAARRTVVNDLGAAVEVHSEGSWKVLYPEAACQVATDFQIRLREDPTIIGTTASCVSHDLEVRASEIDDFSTRCKQWLEDEQDAIRNEEEEAWRRASLRQQQVRADQRQAFVFWAVILGHWAAFAVLLNTEDPTQSLLAYNEPEYRSVGEAFQVAAVALGSFLLSFCISCTDRLVPAWRVELSAAFGCATFIFDSGCSAAFILFQEDLLAVCATGVTVGWIARHLQTRYSAAFFGIIFCIYIVSRSILRPTFAFRPFWDVFRDSAIALGISVLVFFISWSERGSTRTGVMVVYFLSFLVFLVISVAYLAGVAVPLSFGFSAFTGIFTRFLLFPGAIREGLEEETKRNALSKTITFEGTVSRAMPCNFCVISGLGRKQSRLNEAWQSLRGFLAWQVCHCLGSPGRQRPGWPDKRGSGFLASGHQELREAQPYSTGRDRPLLVSASVWREEAMGLPLVGLVDTERGNRREAPCGTPGVLF
ncbi:unnamed protein product [Symbiodinium sp. CCMP2456]|nr:unnamed protein product [Symbiodinium sp. CCMP2456]